MAGVTLWSILFIARTLQMGGIDPTYKDDENQLLAPIRERLTQVVESSLPYPQSTILSGILLGTRGKIPYWLSQDLKTTSTIHIVVVSGQNLSLLAGFILSLAGFLGRRKTITLSLLTITFYSILTGLEIPVLRAALMAGLSYTGQLIGKERTGWWILIITAGGMLLYNPNWFLSISFQLSFLATLGVVVVAPVLQESFKKVPNILKQDLSTTLAAQALVLPVIAYNFSQLSLIGVLVNILILWTIPLIMISGLIVLLLGLVSPFLGQWVGLIPSILLTYFINLVDVFADLPGASLKIGETGMILWIGYYLLIMSIIWILKVKLESKNNKNQI